MDNLVSTRERFFEVSCNWKAFLEVFNEYYHLPFVHPETIGDIYQLPEFPDTTKGSFASQFEASLSLSNYTVCYYHIHNHLVILRSLSSVSSAERPNLSERAHRSGSSMFYNQLELEVLK